MADDNGLIEKVMLVGGSILTAIAGSKAWEYFASRRKTAAEATSISTSSNRSLLEMSEQVAKDYIDHFREATRQLQLAGDEIEKGRREIRQAKEHQEKATVFIRKMLAIIKDCDADVHDALQKEANAIFGGES